ncbi:MAG: hypothetical protein R3F35_12290 [Myxococcota bacterium]
MGSLLLALTVAVAFLPEALLEPPPIELELAEPGAASPPPIHALLRPWPIGLPRFDPAPSARTGRARPVIVPRSAELRSVGQPRGQPRRARTSRLESADLLP